MIKRIQCLAMMAAAGALLAVPAAVQASHKPSHTKGGHGPSRSHGRSCAKKPTVNKGFVVRGTLVSYDAGSPATGDETVTLTVTGRNRHARRVDLTDTDGATAGVQYQLKSGDDPFKIRLSGFDAGPTDIPAAGDRVRVIGKVAVTRKKCAAPGTSLEDRYGDVNVRKVKIIDATP